MRMRTIRLATIGGVCLTVVLTLLVEDAATQEQGMGILVLVSSGTYSDSPTRTQIPQDGMAMGYFLVIVEQKCR